MCQIGVGLCAESISGDEFATGSRISVLTAHAETLSSQKSPKTGWRAGNDRLVVEKIGALNSKTTSDFIPEVVM